MQDAIIEYLEAERWIVTRVHLGTYRSMDGKRVVRLADEEKNGFPDLIATKLSGFLHGNPNQPFTRTLFIEDKCKGKGGRLSPDQEDWRDRLLGAGYEWLLARSVDALKEYLER